MEKQILKVTMTESGNLGLEELPEFKRYNPIIQSRIIRSLIGLLELHATYLEKQKDKQITVGTTW
jgi:hypothetical protein